VLGCDALRSDFTAARFERLYADEHFFLRTAHPVSCSVMHNESGKGDDAERSPNKKPELGIIRGASDPRVGESALAKEFAQRALAPLISDLRGRHGRFEPRRIAGALGISAQRFADCLEVSLDAVQASPPPPGLEDRLEPFAMVIGIVRDVYGGDSDRVRTWLRTPRPELDGETPIDAMCVPSGIQRVIQFVLGAWLRNAD
jgi:hypothetical protein